MPFQKISPASLISSRAKVHFRIGRGNSNSPWLIRMRRQRFLKAWIIISTSMVILIVRMFVEEVK